MKFTKLQDGVIKKTFNTFAEAMEYYGSSEGIQPVMTLEEYQKLHIDYKGFRNGQPTVLYLSDKGTVSGECLIIQGF